MKKSDKKELDFIISQSKKVFIGISILAAAVLILLILL